LNAPQLIIMAQPSPLLGQGPIPPSLGGTWPPTTPEQWCGQFKVRVGAIVPLLEQGAAAAGEPTA